MSWNRIIVSICTVCSLSVSLLDASSLTGAHEDELIVRGILYDEYGSYDNSYHVYRELFDATGAEVYLYKEASAALMAGKYIDQSIDRLKKWDMSHPDSIKTHRMLIPLYLTSKQVVKAKKEAEILLEHSTLPRDLDLASNSFLYAGEYRRALDLLEKIYAVAPQERLLLRMVELMDGFTGERKKAIQLLETYRRMHKASYNIYAVLLLMYQKEKDLDGILETYKAIYRQDNNPVYLSKIISAYGYKHDIDGAIAFLEHNHADDALLYELYRERKEFSKALKLTDKLYKKEKNSKWIAEKGIMIFESAVDKNDKKMLENVLSQFEKAIALGNDDSIYLNYYGYTLIDKNIDIQKGMKIVRDALAQQPDNSYYLDSLAWGYYKERECTKAYELMKRVVDEEGLEEKEIVAHWSAIKQCK